MQIKAMQGYFENGVFYQHGRSVALPERQLVIINILDIPVDAEEAAKNDVAFLAKFGALVKESADEGRNGEPPRQAVTI